MLNETFSVIFKHRDNIEIEFENKELSLIICEYSAEKLYIEVSLKMQKHYKSGAGFYVDFFQLKFCFWWQCKIL